MYQLDDDHQFNLLDSRSNKRSIAVRLPDALQYMEDLSEDAVVVSPGENKRTLTRPLSLSLVPLISETILNHFILASTVIHNSTSFELDVLLLPVH